MEARFLSTRYAASHIERFIAAARAHVTGVVSETNFLILLAAVIGLGSGLGAVAFRWGIETLRTLLLVDLAGWLHPAWLFPLIPMAGGLVVGYIVLRWAPEARGHGVPEVMAAVATQEGRIRPRVAIVKSIASALCIASGGAVGREGPIVQIGSSLGSSIGQFAGVTDQRLRILVGCGAAAGISATFNAPIAGVIFALEVILGDFTITAFSPIIISSVLATALSRAIVGNEPAFQVPQYQTFSPHELGYYALLGLLVGGGAVLFTRALYFAEDRFQSWNLPELSKPVLGGFGIGLIGLVLPQVLGVGYETITDVVHNRLGVELIVALLAAKLVATCLTLGSGGSGGVFAPSLFLGATLGGLFGTVLQVATDGAIQPGAYALVGMGAFVAGTTHAPLTAMLILFELTDDYKIILPLMLATTLSTLVAKRLYSESIYTLKLARRGLHVAQGVDRTVLQSVRVADVVSEQVHAVRLNNTLGDVVHLLQEDGSTDFPVVDKTGALCGIVSFQDIRGVMLQDDLHPVILVADMMRTPAPAVNRETSLLDALHLFTQSDIHNLPVVESGNGQRLTGMVTRASLMERYNQEIRRQMSRHSTSRNTHVGD